MPPAPKRHCTVILYDLNTQNKDKSLQTLLKISCKHFFSASKDLCKLILVNSSQTKNRLNAHYGGYEHVYEVNPEVSSFNPSNMLDVIEDSPPGEANWLEALSIGAKCLAEDCADIQGIITLQLLFITDLSSPLKGTAAASIREIVDDLNSMGAYLYIVGPEISVPHMITSADMIKLWMRDLVIDASNANLVAAKEIITGLSHAVICNYDLGTQLYFSYKNWKGTQPWKVPLSIGTKIEIPAQTMKVLQPFLDCRLVTDKGSGDSVRIWVDAEDETVEVDEANIVKGINRHNKFVEMPDRKMFQVANMRGFSVLCFTSSENIPEYLMSEDCYYVLPNGNSEVMAALVDVLAKHKKYIVARRIYNNNYIPKIVALVPKPDHTPKCFILASLPFKEDLRLNYHERPVESVSKVAIDKNVESFLKRMDSSNAEVFKRFPLSPNIVQDMNCERIIHKAADKLIGRQNILGDVGQIAVAEVGADLKSVWPTREKQKVEKKAEDSDDSIEEDDW